MRFISIFQREANVIISLPNHFWFMSHRYLKILASCFEAIPYYVMYKCVILTILKLSSNFSKGLYLLLHYSLKHFYLALSLIVYKNKSKVDSKQSFYDFDHLDMVKLNTILI